MRTYVVCIDGTWNHPSQTDSDGEGIEFAAETNVVRVFSFLTQEVRTGDREPLGAFHARESTIRPLCPVRPGEACGDVGSVLYLAGVGSLQNRWVNALTGATGVGTWARIKSAYRFLAERHEEGDCIFGFGFSRGAYAVRSLAGLLQHVGLPSKPQSLSDSELARLCDAYSEGRRLFRNRRPAEVRFLGLWDTVGALAFDGALGLSHNISPGNVKRVAHALALDEQRQDFEPEYWAANPGRTRVKEVWFSGVHSNVGGGYKNQELSNIALAWVMSEAVRAGLPTRREYVQGWFLENSLGDGRDSHKEFLENLWIAGRLIKGRPQRRRIRAGQGIHRSVFDRVEGVVAEYSTGGLGMPPGWEQYTPAAHLANGDSLSDTGKKFRGRIFETPDYLDRHRPQAT